MVVEEVLGWGQTLPVVGRDEWFAERYKRNVLGLNVLPIKHVVFQSTETPLCGTRRECIRTIKKLQNTHFEEGEPDIRYSFMVGGDGVIYKGRGWHFIPSLTPMVGEAMSTISIAFIGNFLERNIPIVMAAAGLDLIKLGFKKSFILPTFRLTPIKMELRPVI